MNVHELEPGPSVLFVANGAQGSAAVERAERFANVLPYSSQVLVRTSGRLGSIRDMGKRARAFAPTLVYCVDLAVVPLAVSMFAGRAAGLVVDTGDYPSAFFRQVGASTGRVVAARAMEEFVYRRADAVVVRGRHHAAVMRGKGVRRVETIPDGVDLELARVEPDLSLRKHLGLLGVLTVGVAGHFTWYAQHEWGLGCELIHALAELPDVPVHGVLIGDGPGVPHLRVLAAKLGVSERLHLLGRVPYSRYFQYLTLIDVCLLTQTNDPSSWVRTTGKLPAYLASGRYVLASAVGTAHEILPDDMLIPYDGRWDKTYPRKLADRIRHIATHPETLAAAASLRSLSHQFAYPIISAQSATLISQLISRRSD